MLSINRISYSPGWSAKAEKMGRSVCLAPELSYIDNSRQFCCEIVSQPSSEPAKQIPESKPGTVSHPQICPQDESNRAHVSFTLFKPLSMSNKPVSHVHGLINLLLVKRQRRDFIGPRSPLSPFTLAGEKWRKIWAAPSILRVRVRGGSEKVTRYIIKIMKPERNNNPPTLTNLPSVSSAIHR